MSNSQELNVQQAVPFFMVKDMNASLQFYIDGLGFELKNTWTPRGRIEWCWLQLGNASIMLQEHGKESSEHGKVYLENKKGLGVSICFQCTDAIALYHEFKSKGIDVSEPFVGNSLWDIKIADPDNYNLHFESPTDVPEKTKYSDWIKTNS